MKILLTGCLAALLIAGCGGAKGKTGGKTAGDGSAAVLGRIDEGARCETKDRRESLVDLNQDGVADVRKVYMTKADVEILVCREADLNFDSIKDMFMFFGEDGLITRDEIDLDYDGNIDIISTYAKGKVIKQEIDTNSDGLVDRLRYLENDVPIRVEGDTDGDHRIDYWEYYEAGKLVRIGFDEDGDGRADSWSRDSEAETATLDSEDAPTEDSIDTDAPAGGEGEAAPAEEATEES